jgi:type IV secretory pathway TraG/TraD family ATPase VirD4
VWLFDPQRITGSGQRWWWNPLGGLATVEAAHRLASHFVLTVEDNTRRDLWGPAAQDLLCALFLAAASSGRSLRECSRWLADAGSPIPAELLGTAGFRALAWSLRGAQNGAPETRDGIYQTARTAAKCLNDEDIMAWVTPPGDQGLPAIDPAAFAASRDALYLLTESRSAASPLIAALTDTVMRAGRRQAERAGGRLDPPMVVVLDEAANICRIADLPELYSHLGSRGMVPVTILQSYQQGVAVWGEPGMAALWGRAPRRSSAPASTTRGTPVTWPPWSASTTCRSSPSATETAGRASRSRCAARRFSNQPTSAPSRPARPFSWPPEPAPR